MQSVKALNYREDSMPQFSKRNMEEVISYFLRKNLKRIEVNFFVPFTGYNNPTDALDRVKKQQYLEFNENESLKMETQLNYFIDIFYDVFSKSFDLQNKNAFIQMCRFSLYEPKIYSDFLVDSKFRVISQILERIEEQEDEQVQVVYLIDNKYKKDYSFEQDLPFVNYIFFDS